MSPLQNTVMDEDEDEFQEEDNIHCIGDDAGNSYLTQHDYDEALMSEQINEIAADNGVFQTDDGNKYNLRSKSNTAKQSTLSPPSKKITIPAKKPTQKDQVLDDQPIIFLGQMIEDRYESYPPFYISLNTHEKTLHNCLLDSGASHNLMPKEVMDELGLDITKIYHDVFSFDSRKVKCLGMIKDLAVTLTLEPMKTMLMDIVVADIPPKFGCFLSRSWMKRLEGTLQMDPSYATIPGFGGGNKILYRESQLAYIISDEQNPSNHPIYSIDTGMGSCILQFDDSLSDSLLLKQLSVQPIEVGKYDLWSMFFDGACTKETVGAWVVLISPSKETTHLSFKLDFQVTNNIVEYEAFLLGLNVAK
jgi:hypothetical protein